jgi:hypothetical protein
LVSSTSLSTRKGSLTHCDFVTDAPLPNESLQTALRAIELSFCELNKELSAQLKNAADMAQDVAEQLAHNAQLQKIYFEAMKRAAAAPAQPARTSAPTVPDWITKAHGSINTSLNDIRKYLHEFIIRNADFAQKAYALTMQQDYVAALKEHNANLRALFTDRKAQKATKEEAAH